MYFWCFCIFTITKKKKNNLERVVESNYENMRISMSVCEKWLNECSAADMKSPIQYSKDRHTFVWTCMTGVHISIKAFLC